jgi:hypothetical protein
MGAIISFCSSIGTAYLATKGEERKTSMEQKLSFEREVVVGIANNISTAKRLLQEGDFYLSIDSMITRDALVRTSTSLLMNAYVRQDICDTFNALNDSVSSIEGNISWFRHSGIRAAGRDIAYQELVGRIKNTEAKFDKFMRDFHSAILK